MKKYIDIVVTFLDFLIIYVIEFIASRIEHSLVIQAMIVLCALEFVFDPSITTISVIVVLGFEYMYNKAVADDIAAEEEVESITPD